MIYKNSKKKCKHKKKALARVTAAEAKSNQHSVFPPWVLRIYPSLRELARTRKSTRWCVCCSVCGALQCVAVCCRVMQCVAVCCSVLQCVALCCSVLQRVAVCCSEPNLNNTLSKPAQLARTRKSMHWCVSGVSASICVRKRQCSCMYVREREYACMSVEGRWCAWMCARERQSACT